MSVDDVTGLTDPVAEREVIGGLLRHPARLTDVAAVLDTATAFTDTSAAAAYQAFMTLLLTGQPITLAAVREHIRAASDNTIPDLNAWLTELLRAAPLTSTDVLYAAQRVADRARKRGAHERLLGLLTSNSSLTDTYQDTVDNVMAAAAALDGGGTLADLSATGDTVLLRTMEALDERARLGGALPGLSTGSKDLDDITLGLRPGQLVIVGGRPAVGKSVVAIDLLRAAVRQGAGVLLFTLEMPATQIGQRIIAAEAKINTRKLLRGDLTDDEWAATAEVSRRFNWELLVVVDQPGVTVTQVAALTMQQVQRWKAAGVTRWLIVVDYLQIMAEPVGLRRDASRQQALGVMTVELKNLARRTESPVVVLSQLGRTADADRPPVMKDLRESGDIENNADVVILLHRPEAQDPENRPGEIEYIFAKNRESATGVCVRVAQMQYARTSDAARL